MERDLSKRLDGAFETADEAQIAAIVREARQTPDINYKRFLAAGASIALSYKSERLVKILVEQDRAVLDLIEAGDIAQDFSRSVLETLVELGWDINKVDTTGDGMMGPPRTILQILCDDDELVRWCLDHGASVDGSATHSAGSSAPASVLDSVASKGSVDIFDELRARGAKPGPRTLHLAVSAAASRKTSSQKQEARMAMVKHLVEDLKLDVNALDTTEPQHRYWGTPLCYAVKGSAAEDVVRYLLAHGADPTVKDSWNENNAISLAEKSNPDLVEMLRQH